MLEKEKEYERDGCQGQIMIKSKAKVFMRNELKQRKMYITVNKEREIHSKIHNRQRLYKD